MQVLNGQLISELLPQIFLYGGAIVCALYALLRPRAEARLFRTVVAVCCIGSIAAAAISMLHLGDANTVGAAYDGQIFVDRLSLFCTVLVAAVTLVASWIVPWSTRALPRPGAYQVLVLLAAGGVVSLVSEQEAGALLVSLSLVWLALVGLQALPKTGPEVARAAWRQLLFSSIGLALLALGFALMYALTGSTQLNSIASAPAASQVRAMVMICLMFGTLVFVGWPPSVLLFQHNDESAVAGQRGFVLSISAIAGTMLLLRVFAAGAGYATHSWTWLLAVMAALATAYSAISAWRATTPRRLMALAVLNQGGVVATAIAAAGNQIHTGVTISLLALISLLAGIAALSSAIALVENAGLPAELTHWRGLARRSPVAALFISLGFLSLAGLPPLLGFFSRFFALQETFSGGFAWLGMLIVIGSVFLLVPTLKVIGLMYGESVVAPPFLLTRTPRDGRLVAGFAAVAPLGMVFLLSQLALALEYAASSIK